MVSGKQNLSFLIKENNRRILSRGYRLCHDTGVYNSA